MTDQRVEAVARSPVKTNLEVIDRRVHSLSTSFPRVRTRTDWFDPSFTELAKTTFLIINTYLVNERQSFQLFCCCEPNSSSAGP